MGLFLRLCPIVSLALLAVIHFGATGVNSFVIELPGSIPHATPAESKNALSKIGFPEIRKTQRDAQGEYHWTKWKRSALLRSLLSGNQQAPPKTGTEGGATSDNKQSNFGNEHEPTVKFLNTLQSQATNISENKNNIDGSVMENLADTDDFLQHTDVSKDAGNTGVSDSGAATYSSNNAPNVVGFNNDQSYISNSIDFEISPMIEDEGGFMVNPEKGEVTDDRYDDIFRADKNIIPIVSNELIFGDSDGTSDSGSDLFNDGAIVTDARQINGGSVANNSPNNSQFLEYGGVSHTIIDYFSPSVDEGEPKLKYIVKPITLNDNMTLHVAKSTSLHFSFFSKFLNLFSPFQDDNEETTSENQEDTITEDEQMSQFLEYQYIITISIYMIGWVLVATSIIVIVANLNHDDESKECSNEDPNAIEYT